MSAEPVWIDEGDARALHDRLLVRFGGAQGLRDETLLQSALARPRQIFAYANAADIVGMASAYTAGIVKNHPFVDGNKRTGFVVGVLFLELNGLLFTAPEDAATDAVLRLATGEMDEQQYALFLREHCNDVALDTRGAE